MKERLTGAIILVAVLVLLVPELLTGPSPSVAAKPAGAEGAPLRSYTIDLADDASRRPGAPAAAPSVVTEEPVGQASAEPDAGAAADGELPAGSTGEGGSSEASPPAASAGTSAGESTSTGPSTPANSGATASTEPEKPRSAFGPNAPTRAQSEPARAQAPARASGTSGSAARPSGQTEAAAPATRPSSTPAKGWAVQLGVFANRENADRLAKQVKGKGYPVVVNETSGSKRLYRVRVGPEADRAAAVALGAKLRAAGHAGAVVPLP